MDEAQKRTIRKKEGQHKETRKRTSKPQTDMRPKTNRHKTKTDTPNSTSTDVVLSSLDSQTSDTVLKRETRTKNGVNDTAPTFPSNHPCVVALAKQITKQPTTTKSGPYHNIFGFISSNNCSEFENYLAENLLLQYRETNRRCATSCWGVPAKKRVCGACLTN